MLFRHIPASVFAPQANQLLQASQPTRAPKSKPSTPTPTASQSKVDVEGSQDKASRVVSFEAGMSAKDYIEEFYMLVPQKTDESDDISAREYAGINGQALTRQALSFVQNFICNALDACMDDYTKAHTDARTLRSMIQNACKILAILSKYQAPSTIQGYFSGTWLEKMRTASCKVRIKR